MISDISIGRYYKASSPIHDLDPRVKVLMFVIYMIVVFSIKSVVALAFLTVITVAMYICGKIPVRVVVSTLKPIIPLALFIMILNIFTIHQGKVIYSYGIINITRKGLITGLLMGYRIVMMILSTSILLTLTTTPLKLSDALEKLFGPMKKIGLPVHEMSMMMSIALRFIPTLVEETDKIMKAQVSRGANYDTGSFVSRVKGYITVLVPLFVSSFKRAEELATAMDARCYTGGEGRTKLNPLIMTSKDYIIALVLFVVAVFTVVIDRI